MLKNSRLFKTKTRTYESLDSSTETKKLEN